MLHFCSFSGSDFSGDFLVADLLLLNLLGLGHMDFLSVDRRFRRVGDGADFLDGFDMSVGVFGSFRFFAKIQNL